MESLPNKYRPKIWDEFVGNESMVQSLRSVLNREEGRPHTIMLEGPSGCGKTTLARLIAKELRCSDEDFREYNISDMRGIDTARNIIQQVRYSPLQGDVKVYVLNECHQATKEFMNAMLDILEFTPPHVYFVLCTTEPEKVLSTIRGQRAQVFKVQPLIRNLIVKLLKDVTVKEGLDPLPNKHYLEIANCADGSPRKALAILDQIIDIENLDQAFDAILSSSVGEKEVKDIIDFFMKPGRKDWKQVSAILKKMDLTGNNPEDIRRSLKAYFGSVLLNRGDLGMFDLMILFLEPYYASGREGLIASLYLACQL